MVMENGGESEDNQGSGWLEVRKKHRITSKLSVQKVSGGSSDKAFIYSPQYVASTNHKNKTLHVDQRNASIKGGSGLSSDSKVPDEACLDKLVVDQVSDHYLKAGKSNTGSKPCMILTKKLDDLPKIKWGDIEDVSFTVPVCGGDSSTLTETANLATFDAEEQGKLVAAAEEVVLVSSSTPILDGEITSASVEWLPDGMLRLGAPLESLVGKREGVSVVSTEFDIANSDLRDASENLEESRDGAVVVTQNKTKDDCTDDKAIGKCTSLGSPVEGLVEISIDMFPNRSFTKSLNISETFVENDIALKNADQLDNSLEKGDSKAEASLGAATVTTTGNILVDGPYLGEGEPREGKERFRERLWCFLFENLNRAVDELYLLCELESDMEQMNEAILVLEEAISDFRELKCRVEHFDNTKRLSAQSSKDVTATNLKIDHRRPHALSWEVRRMTTSPHRAEILSSSLEAFRKIQEERANKYVVNDVKDLNCRQSTVQHYRNSPRGRDTNLDGRKPSTSSERCTSVDAIQGSIISDKSNPGSSIQSTSALVQASHLTEGKFLDFSSRKCKEEPLGTILESEKQVSRKDKIFPDNTTEEHSNSLDMAKRNSMLCDKEKEKDRRNSAPWKSMDAWKEKRNWEDILKSPLRSSSRVSCSPSIGRKVVERARVLHDKLISPEKKKKSALDLRREAEERHARALRIRGQLENERLQRLQRASEKLSRVSEWQAVRSSKLREGLNARHQRSESRHEAYLAQVVKRAGDESSKVNEVRFITSLNEENKKLILRQKLHDSELRRAEKIQIIKIKQKEDLAREEAAMERRKLLEAEKFQRIAETQRKKEEAQLRREEERKASSAAREAKAVEQLRRRETRARVQQEEAELLAQRLFEKLSESEQRRKFYLEQIREKASADFRDQSSPLLRRSLNRDGQSRPSAMNAVDNRASYVSNAGASAAGLLNPAQQHPLKRRIKRIRQRLMALKHEFIEPPIVAESSVVGYRVLLGTARSKIGKWLQELQRLLQARKEGSSSIGLIVSDMIKFLDGKDLELHACRQAGLLDFISSAVTASYTSKPEACQVTVYLLRLLRVVLSIPANREYFLAQNLLPPIVLLLSTSLDNYIKVAAASNPGSSNVLLNRTNDNLDSITEVLDGFLFAVTAVMGYETHDERQIQMLDGLLELIVSYQTVHRLRDLFALYDRPQVEGSPFPSSILLSLKLLLVLTSRPGSISLINWEACMSKLTPGVKDRDSESFEYQDVEDKYVTSDPFDQIGRSLPTTECTPVDESTKTLEKKSLPTTVLVFGISEKRSSDGSFSKELLDVSVGSNDAAVASCHVADTVPGEKLSFDQEIENITIDRYLGTKKIEEPNMPDNYRNNKEVISRQPLASILSAMVETGLVSLTSLLTAVLLQANNRISTDQASYALPSNFEEVATYVLKVLNNLAILDISLLQKMLARSDLKMEFFHLMSFLLSHCTSKWKSSNDQVGLLLLESLLLLGYFALFHHGNQAVLRWGKRPTILHKVCDLPFVFFSDPELTPILAGTFVSACYGSEQNRGVVQQELSMDMLLTLLKSSKSSPDNITANSPVDAVSLPLESQKSQLDNSSKSNYKNLRNLSSAKGRRWTNRISRARVQREVRGAKPYCDDKSFKLNQQASESPPTFMLHKRFPPNVWDKAEDFFAAGSKDDVLQHFLFG
ncbi:hypothetical protein AXF42_Ash015932 [Apostasia shenzhenica]|uniref:S phase cyclin A-associated protein in the endoplasmic reticulum N-terminal domain-containing protein n=1 Tax=Apostasia shenzhenica TaxID=1088818 RepID=A0A2I0AWF0_9ASPA|nr:hypothetical protein AXF42_Ash015932 [Apostasia shenzhenica]